LYNVIDCDGSFYRSIILAKFSAKFDLDVFCEIVPEVNFNVGSESVMLLEVGGWAAI
jgi:hypothetical protein